MNLTYRNGVKEITRRTIVFFENEKFNTLRKLRCQPLCRCDKKHDWRNTNLLLPTRQIRLGAV